MTHLKLMDRHVMCHFMILHTLKSVIDESRMLIQESVTKYKKTWILLKSQYFFNCRLIMNYSRKKKYNVVAACAKSKKVLSNAI